MVKRKALISGLTLLGVASVATGVAVSLTSCAQEAASVVSSFNDKLIDLFTFNFPFLPSEKTKTAIVDNQYANFKAAKDAPGNTAVEGLMKLFKKQLLEAFNSNKNSITLDDNSIRESIVQGETKFNYQFKIGLSDNVCKALYGQTRQDLFNSIQDTSDYDQQFNYARPSSIESIELIFTFKLSKEMDDKLVGFSLTQDARFTFENNNPLIFRNILSSNNNQYNIKPMLFFVVFQEGDTQPVQELESVSFTEDQVKSFMELVRNHLAQWTKTDVESLNHRPGYQTDNPKFKELLSDVNQFFTDNGLDLEISDMNMANTVLWYKDGKVGIKPFFIFDQFKLISLPANCGLYYSYDMFPPEGASNLEANWFLFFNDANPVYTNAPYEELNLSEADLTEFKGIVEEMGNAITTIATDVSQSPFKEAVDEISSSLSTKTGGKFSVYGNVWGGDASYTPSKGTMVMDFAICPQLVPETENKTKFIKVNVPSEDFLKKEKLSLKIYQGEVENDPMNSFIVFNDVGTSIEPPFIVDNNMATKINDVLKKATENLKTRLNPTGEDGLIIPTSENGLLDYANEISEILNSPDDVGIEVAGFNVWGNWDNQYIDPQTGKQYVKLAIVLNIPENSGFNQNYVEIQSNLFEYDDTYKTLVPNQNYITSIPGQIIINEDQASQINTILTNIVAGLTTKEDINEVFNKHQTEVEKINTILRSCTNADQTIKVTHFNIWGGWGGQQVVEGKYQVKLAIQLNVGELGYATTPFLINSESLKYGVDGANKFLVPATAAPSQIPQQ